MPDILIRGMEMPHNCFQCPLSVLKGERLFCKVTKEEVLRAKLAPECPLHELPPHGDLIDRRELLSTVMQVVTKFPTINIAAIEHLDLVSALLRGATVVIPAEKGEGK